MDRHIKDIIEELNIHIVYDPNLDKSAHYIPRINCIVLNTNLDEFDMTKALLHELGHAAQHQGNQVLYHTTHSMHEKMENEAEVFMIRQLIKQYLSLPGADINAVNYIDFIANNELDMSLAPTIQKMFLEYGK